MLDTETAMKRFGSESGKQVDVKGKIEVARCGVREVPTSQNVHR